MTSIAPILGAALVAGTAFAAADAAQPGDRRTGTIEVTVTYAGQGSWKRSLEHGSHVYDRKLVYRMPLVGHYGPASGFEEIDAKLPPAIEGPIPEQKMSKADIADLSATFEAAEAACGEDEDCLVQAMKGKARQLHAAGKIEVPKQMPKANLPDFARFLVISGDCPRSVATLSAADRYDETLIEGSEGAGGLRRQTYSVAGTATLRGGKGDKGDTHHCRFNAVIDTRTNMYGLQLPIWARVAASDGRPGGARDVDFTGTGGSARLAEKLDARTRWLELPMPAGGKLMTGHRVLENVNDAGPDGTPIRATVDWKITLD
ncbi:hypothetical protein [Sphingomonas oleivorans]|nr:hypothetical protein [Sphingomonas oleivorans]